MTIRASVVTEGGELFVDLHDTEGGQVRIPLGQVRSVMTQIVAAEIAAEKMHEVYAELAEKFGDSDVSFEGILNAAEEFRAVRQTQPRTELKVLTNSDTPTIPRDLRMLPPVSFRWHRLEGQYTYIAKAMGHELTVFRPDDSGEPRWYIKVDDQERTITDDTGGERVWFRTKREAQQVAEFLVRKSESR